MRFLHLRMHSNVPDARTIWLFREALRNAQAVEKLFKIFDNILSEAGFAASGGQIIDATFVEVPRQRNDHDENDGIKRGEKPSGWSKKKSAHKDIDARWTKKDGVNHYGYKNHINADVKYKIIRRYKITSANIHDSQEIRNIIDDNCNNREIYADSAYHSAEDDKWLHDAGYTSNIHQRGYRGHPLSDEQKAENTEKSRIRVRVEHIFANMEITMRGKIVRSIGITRANINIGLKNLAYNISRLLFLMAYRA